MKWKKSLSQEATTEIIEAAEAKTIMAATVIVGLTIVTIIAVAMITIVAATTAATMRTARLAKLKAKVATAEIAMIRASTITVAITKAEIIVIATATSPVTMIVAAITTIVAISQIRETQKLTPLFKKPSKSKPLVALKPLLRPISSSAGLTTSVVALAVAVNVKMSLRTC